VSSPSSSRHEAQRDLAHELAVAERRGANRVRAEVRDLLADSRRVVRLGEHQIEVVELAALSDVLADETD
jgi:hypothetical protein